MVVFFVIFVALTLGLLGAWGVREVALGLKERRYRRSLEGQIDSSVKEVVRLEGYIEALGAEESDPIGSALFAEVAKRKLEHERTRLQRLRADKDRKDFEERMGIE